MTTVRKRNHGHRRHRMEQERALQKHSVAQATSDTVDEASAGTGTGTPTPPQGHRIAATQSTRFPVLTPQSTIHSLRNRHLYRPFAYSRRLDRRRGAGSMASGGGDGNRWGGGGGGGFTGFGNFPDPFAGFGMGMGGGGSRGRSIFDVFDNDPFFHDPFFTRPFGSMFGGQAGGLFGGPQGFIGGSLFDNQTAPRVPRAPAAGYLEDRPRSPPPQFHHQRDPIIVELADSDSDADAEPRSTFRPGQQPIIEHPDDDVRPAEPQERPRPFPSNSVVQAGPLPVNNNGGRLYSFQSSSVSYGGSNGTYYESSAARRMGPNGVVEEEFQEKDSTAGHELKRVSRGLGVKGRSITRKRTSEGREQTLETLHNLQEDEVPTFERTWEDRAKSLPQWNRNRSRTIGAPHGNPEFLGSGSRSRVALPGSSSSQGGRQ